MVISTRFLTSWICWGLFYEGFGARSIDMYHMLSSQHPCGLTMGVAEIQNTATYAWKIMRDVACGICIVARMLMRSADKLTNM